MMSAKFMQYWPVFLDRVFGFVYEWLWKAFCMYLGMTLMNLYIPGALDYLQPVQIHWMTTIILVSAILTMLDLMIEPVLSRFLFTKPEPVEEVPQVEATK
jgi:hypothetical protein